MSRSAVVVGGGHNGLVAAWRLAKAGVRVVVCEQRDRLGGLAASEEFADGYRSPGIHHDTSTFRPWLAEEMKLTSHGWASRPAPPTVIAVDTAIGHVLGPDGALESGGDQATGHAAWRGFLARVKPAVARLLDSEPPRLEARGLGDLLGLAFDGWAVRRLGRRTMTELLRIGPMPASDWLRESLSEPSLIAGLIAPGVLGTWLGPHSSGSSATLLAHECMSGHETVGGPGALVAALEAACRSVGVEFQLGSRAERLTVEAGAVKAIHGSAGLEIECDRVLTTCDPKAAFALLPPAVVPMAMRDQIRSWRTRGTVAKIHLALAGPLALEDRPFESLWFGAGSIDGLEQAFDAVKYGQRSVEPVLQIRQPTLADPSLAPEGGHVASVMAGWVPHGLADGWDQAARDAVLESVIARVERSVPAIRELIVASEVLTPVDIEARFGASGGHLHHGEHALDQLLFVRPSHRLAHYATPVAGLFLAGSGSHPGGGLTGVPGWLGAAAALA